MKEILEEERERRTKNELPEHASAPIFKGKTFKQLGTPTPQMAQLPEGRTELSAEELLEAAEQERQRLEAACELTSMAGDQQPEDAPAFGTLQDAELEVR